MRPNQNPEQAARDRVDQLLTDSGWLVQSKKAIDFNAGPGIAKIVLFAYKRTRSGLRKLLRPRNQLA